MKSPSEDQLAAVTKDNLIKVAEHYAIEIPTQGRKDRIFAVIKEGLVQLGVLVTGIKEMDEQDSVSPQGSLPDQPVENVQPVAGVGLTFEQQKELLILKHRHELEREEWALD